MVLACRPGAGLAGDTSWSSAPRIVLPEAPSFTPSAAKNSRFKDIQTYKRAHYDGHEAQEQAKVAFLTAKSSTSFRAATARDPWRILLPA